jgi:hypothetical protein
MSDRCLLDSDGRLAGEFDFEWPEKWRPDSRVVLRVEDDAVGGVVADVLPENRRDVGRAEQIGVLSDLRRFDAYLVGEVARVLRCPHRDAGEQLPGVLDAGLDVSRVVARLQ